MASYPAVMRRTCSLQAWQTYPESLRLVQYPCAVGSAAPQPILNLTHAHAFLFANSCSAQYAPKASSALMHRVLLYVHGMAGS